MTDIDLTLEQRIAALETLLAPDPLALVPPITIGSIADVPAPGSQLAAAWAQEVSGMVIHRFANVAALKAWAAPNGSRAVQTDNGVEWRRYGGAWSQLTPSRLVGTPSASTGSVANTSTVVNTLTIPADAAPRVAMAMSFTQVQRTATPGTPSALSLIANSVVLATANISPPAPVGSIPWFYYGITHAQSITINPGVAVTINVAHWTSDAFTTKVEAAPAEVNNLTAIIMAVG